MNKKGAVLSLLLAGAMSIGMVASAGCKKSDTHLHTWKYEDDGAIGHHRITTCNSHDPVDEGIIMPHDGDVCSLCGYDKNSGKPTDPTDPTDPSDPKDPTDPTDPTDPDDPEAPVVLSEDTAISLTVGETKTLSAADGAQWTSSDNNVATVGADGLVRAIGAGVAKVRATSGNNVLTCTVIVLSPLGGASEGGSKPAFTFSKSVNIGSVSSSPSLPGVSDPNASEYRVEFSNGAVTQNVAKGGTVVEPLVDNDGNYLTGWRTAGATSDYDFSTPVNSNMVLTAQWAALPAGVSLLKGNYESIAVEFDGTAATSKVYYRRHASSDSWNEIDGELIRDVDGVVRADIVGISAGVYDVKVNGTEITGGVHVAKYDRSGYAHFKYTDGIGAYNDDGTLKDNALVIYVTDENKDTVMKDLAATNSLVAAQMFDIPYYAGVSGADKNWNKKAEGIGWWLNNVQYTKKDASSGKVNSNTYSANGSSLGFGNTAFDNTPVVIRFIGTVTTPEGCTAYNSLGEGGSVGDNGHMARMKNLKNITLEGIGEDAQIKGWGFHFMAGSDAKNGRGKGFEVRNITFNEYPEDAVGMEGVQSGSTITGSVERCWIHNNTFLPGRCDSPAESDKKEGDGSCDFKRGMYFTCSYNYFEYCHKTNLVGSSDTSLQYNMTYHHNIWYQCGSRIPLTRQANVHFYNNYIFGDPAETSTPYSHIAKPSLSYVHSLRASCYLFSEANYYEGCKNVTDGKAGGAGKSWNNTFYACSDGGTGTLAIAETREQAISNNCKYQSTDFSTFDTDPNLFYYDAANKTTKTEILDDSVGARIRTVLYAGAQGHGEVTARLQNMNKNAASNVTEITKAVKGKGQLVTFSVAANTTLEINATGVDPQVIRSDGKIIIAPFQGARTAILEAGTYIVCAGNKAKEITINSMSVKEDSEAAKQARIEAAKKAIEAIPDNITRSSASLIEQAEQAYASLITQEGKDAVGAELADRLSKARTAYEEILVAYAIARIDYIGEVTQNSRNDIEAASAAYSAVSASARDKVTNHSTLTAAQAKYNSFKGDTVKGGIDRLLPATAKFALIVDSKPAIELALTLFNSAFNDYEALDSEEDAEIIKNIDITPITKAIDTLTAALKPFDVKDMIAGLPAETESTYLSKVSALKVAYEALSAEQKTMITEAEKAIYDKAIEVYTAYASQAKVAIFDKSNLALATDAGFTVNGKKGYKGTSDTFTYNGTQYSSPLKLQSGDTVTFSTASAMKVTIMLHTGKGQEITVDGTKYAANSDGLIIIDSLAAGDHTIGRVSEAWLCYVELLPA